MSNLSDAARRLLDDEAFKAVCDRLIAAQFAVIASSEADQVSVREGAYFMLRAVAKFEQEMEALANEDAHLKARLEKQRMVS